MFGSDRKRFPLEIDNYFADFKSMYPEDFAFLELISFILNKLSFNLLICS